MTPTELNTSLEPFVEYFDHLYDIIFDYAIIIAAVGTLSMALVDAFKSLFRLRGLYLKWRIRRWINKYDQNHSDLAFDELLSLAAGDKNCPFDWWDQPEEKVFSRIHAAAETALDFPTSYPHIYQCITRYLTHHEKWADHAIAWQSGNSQSVDRSEIDELAALRVRLGSAVTRRIEALQMQVQWYWTKFNQIGAFIISIAIFAIYSSQDSNIGVPIGIGTGALAGLLAPFAKDLVSRISGARIRQR